MRLPHKGSLRADARPLRSVAASAVSPAVTFFKSHRTFSKKALILPEEYSIIPKHMKSVHRGVAKFGIALGSGPRGHGFKSRHSDQKDRTHSLCALSFSIYGT